jgi:hypothetical protein
VEDPNFKPGDAVQVNISGKYYAVTVALTDEGIYQRGPLDNTFIWVKGKHFGKWVPVCDCINLTR